LLEPGDAIGLNGPLGAGKTTLARGILGGLGHDGEVASPSFPIVIVYDPPAIRLPVWHVDLYRIDAPQELDELGLDEARAEVALLVEWPERLSMPWPDMLQLGLETDPAGGRVLTAAVPPAWGGRWPPR
ncbi:MAG: tRNA (adenosine(37)-N6)-threonylcarbamoyltransferase complex ATPase subunit type 1 TsaE, partial [Sphingomonas sp.]